jgi:hypothetical protein
LALLTLTVLLLPGLLPAALLLLGDMAPFL